MKAEILFTLFCIGLYLFVPGYLQPSFALTSTFQVSGSANDVNEDGSTYSATDSTFGM